MVETKVAKIVGKIISDGEEELKEILSAKIDDGIR
jgi:hypothetical protein